MKIKHVISWTLCHINKINVLLEYHTKSVFFWQLIHLSIQILNPNPMIPFLLETGGNWQRYSTNTLDGWKFIKIAIFGKKTLSHLEFGKFFLKRPLLAVLNPGIQVRTWTNPGPVPGPGPILVWVQGLKKVARLDLDRTMDSLASGLKIYLQLLHLDPSVPFKPVTSALQSAPKWPLLAFRGLYEVCVPVFQF